MSRQHRTSRSLISDSYPDGKVVFYTPIDYEFVFRKQDFHESNKQENKDKIKDKKELILSNKRIRDKNYKIKHLTKC